MKKINDNELDNLIRDSKEVIETSQRNNAKEIYQLSKDVNEKKEEVKVRKNNFFSSVRFLRFASMAFLTLFIVVLILAIVFYNNRVNYITNITYVNGEGSSETLVTSKDVKNTRFSRNVTSIDELKSIVNKSTSEIGGRIRLDGLIIKADSYTSIASIDTDSVDYAASSVPLYSDKSGSIYKTNNQEEEADEADIVKVNGNYIYYLPYNANSRSYVSKKTDINKYVYIIKADEGKMEVVKRIGFGEEVYKLKENNDVIIYHCDSTIPLDLYYTDKYLIIRVDTISYEFGVLKSNEGSYNRYNYTYHTEIQVYSLETNELVTTIKTAGSNISSRLIGDDLYVINQYNVYNDDYLPIIYIDKKPYTVSLNRIFYCPGFGTSCSNYVAIYKINLGDEIKVEDYYFLSPYVNNVYVTANHIFLIKNYGSKNFDEYDESDETKSTLTRNIYTVNTILPINIKDDIYAESTVEVKGDISDKYWIDEYNGYLRVASTGTSYSYKMFDKYVYGSQSLTIFNFLTIFKLNEDGEWVEYSSITEGLGEVGEKIKSARFEGDFATIVTFRQTDPLYYVDLSDPLNPVITSSLKITGFSVYQHPYKDDFMIGIGYSATENGSTNGIKVSLFDVSDKENVSVVGKSIEFTTEYFNDGTSKYEIVDYSAMVLNNPKELMLRLDEDLFGFKLTKNIYGSEGSTRSSLYVVFKIDVNCKTPLRIYFQDEYTLGNKSYNSNDRMIFIGDYYYLFKNGGLYSYIDGDGGFEDVSKIKLD